MPYEKRAGVQVWVTLEDPARGMSSSSVRKIQQPPLLERHENMLRRSKGSVNGFSVGSESQVAGIGSHQAILLARRTRTIRMCSSDARSEGQSGDSLEGRGGELS
jgi:hypothetical protein